MATPAALRQQHRERKAQILADLAATGASARGIRRSLLRLAQLADATLSELWQLAALPANAVLCAVGGYGRAELFPHSDIDVLLLLPDGIEVESNPVVKTAIETFISSCWDAGLEIGSSVRTLSECLDEAARDVTIQTALLESRSVAGQAKLHKTFLKRFAAQMDAKAFFVAKSFELRQRHNKFENTPYALEPNCKESPGGLRDLQTILWVAKAAGLGKTWDDLAKNKLATPFEIKQIKRNEALLSLVRARLHGVAKRREDRLVFDLQAVVADSFGLKAQPSAHGHVPIRASELLMRRYYWAAKAVTQLNQILLMNIEEGIEPQKNTPRRINERFWDKAGMIEVSAPDLYVRHPEAILETFLLYQTEVGVKGLSATTLRALYSTRHVMDGEFRNDPRNRTTFGQILRQPEGITHAMRLMNQTSVLGRYLWVFRRIVGQMQHDLFHVYTVDQHILMVLRNVRRFFIAEHSHEYPFCSQLAGGWDKPFILYTAALFHDIAKGRGGDHSVLGTTDARRFCKQHGFAADETTLVEFLVREHLTMSQVAQKSDLSDPDVILAFARRVGSERKLTALYLLTVADIRGTSPKVWNAWKGKLLEDLYRLTLRALGGRAPDAAAELEARKREAIELLARAALPHEAHAALWKTLDVSYFMRHDASDIAWHTRHISRHISRHPALAGVARSEDIPAHKPLVRARQSPAGEGLQVMVYAPDQADLFARICGFFDQQGFSIQDARIHTASDGHALDTFQVDTSAQDEGFREVAAMLEANLTQVITQAGPLPVPSRGRVSRRVKSFPVAPRVILRPDEKAQRWLLNISASDRVGLLYGIARVLARHRINVQLAKVVTLGERVDDTFLIDGPELQGNRGQIAIETELLETLSDSV
jgi:[protein-PII] uridylyltransferase